MKELVLSIILVSGLFFLAQSAFAENMFYGYSSFEKLSSTLSATSTFELKIRYTEGPYAITKLTPVFDVSPESAKQYVQIKTNPIDGLYRNDIARIQSTMIIDPQIPHKKIFVSVYFGGTDSLGNPYKSAWTDSMAVSTEKLESADITQKCSQISLGTKYGKPIDLEYDIEGGIVVSNCKVKDTNSVVTKIDAESDGQLTITIPKNIIYSLSSTDCAEDSDLMILMDNEEVLPIKSIHNKKDNIITVGFSKDVNTIEFVGFSIMPDPSPAQYCGIVMGFDSLYLPPKFQVERGMKAEQIRCNEGLTLLKKASNDEPICVNIKTGQKMLERKLANPTISGLSLEPTPKSESDSEYAEMTVAQKLLSQNQIKYIPDKLVVTSGPVTGGDPRCGAAINVNSTTHWFAIDSISNPQKLILYSENPNQCVVNTASCFCNAQMELAALTLDELSYFSPEEEEKLASILIEYLNKENINTTPKFQIGKFNLNYTNPSVIGYCGELWGYNKYDFFDGAIVNDEIRDYGLAGELSPLCAISKDAKWWERELVKDENVLPSEYDPYNTRCGSGTIPVISEDWQLLGMRPLDKDWETFGKHIVRQKFYHELKNRDIIFEPACFGVYTGPIEESYPPRFAMCSTVTASNGTQIYLEGTVNEFDVTYFNIDNKIPYQCGEHHFGCLCQFK